MYSAFGITCTFTFYNIHLALDNQKIHNINNLEKISKKHSPQIYKKVKKYIKLGREDLQFLVDLFKLVIIKVNKIVKFNTEIDLIN